MLRAIGYISFGFAGVFAFLLLIFLMQKTKKKSLKVRKKIRSRRRFYGMAAFFFLLAGGILQLAAGRANAAPRTFISSGSPVEAYKNSADQANLPEAIFALGDDYYVSTGKNRVYGYLELEKTITDEAGNEQKTTEYQKGLCFRDAQQVTGEGGFLAVLSTRGVLRLTGAFEYLTYEKNNTVFREKVYSRSCTFADATSNNLFYISGGNLYSAGYNAFGQLGDGTARNRLQGVQVLTDVESVSASETHTLAVDKYGNLYGFGDNGYSEMGNRTTAQSITPVKVMTGVKQAEAGRYFSIVLAKNGDVYAAGRNNLGQLGTGDGRDHASFTRILEGIVKISVNGSSCAALSESGALYVWGDNSQHQLGAGEEAIVEPTLIANDVYDVAMGRTSMGILRLNRDVAVSGSARLESNNEFLQAIWQFEAAIPEDDLYRAFQTRYQLVV